VNEVGAAPFIRVEHHMSTAITLTGKGIGDPVADRFFGRIAELEDLLSRFRPNSEISRMARSELNPDAASPLLREVLARCDMLRELTRGDFEYEPRQRTGDPAAPVLDVNALAKGWIIEEATSELRMSGAEFLVNAGGDVTASARDDGSAWRVGVQHPVERTAVLGVFVVIRGAVATSGTYERGDHIRIAGDEQFTSVTVVGPDLGDADALSTAVFSSGQSPPQWWQDVEPTYGLLTVSADNKLRWRPPPTGTEISWEPPMATPGAA
jgi:FAD:protein FMN transferase